MATLMKAEEEHSRVFYRYIRDIGECKTKEEENEIVLKDLKQLRKTVASAHLDTLTRKECVMRVVYAEMLGHSAEFGHIHCVNLSSSNDLCAKRIGYLGTWLCVNPDDDLLYLIVANIQKDMRSSNFLEVSAALDAASRVLRLELMHALGDSVGHLLQHNKALVRRKAVQAMHAFYVKSHGEFGEERLFRQALTDRDPSVMDTAVRLLYDVVRTRPQAQRDLTDAFLSILAQIVQRRLPRDYDYHHLSAPWLQIRIVRLLALVVGRDEGLAKKCEALLVEVMRRADTGSTIGFAVIAEVVAAAAAMPALPNLLELCASAVDGFLASPHANIKYMGMKMLSQVASRYPRLAAQHQRTVMDCLEDSDETIRRRTITLLFAICTEDNIDPISRRIIKYLAGARMQSAAVGSDGRPLASSVDDSGGASDAYLKRNITRGLCLVAERFAPSATWYIHTMNRILLVASECVPYTTVQRMLKLIAEGQDGVDDAENVAFRTYCVESYFAITGGGGGAALSAHAPRSAASAQTPLMMGRRQQQLSPRAVPDLLNRVAAWVMGEYGFLAKKISRPMLMDRLCDMLERADDGFAEVDGGAVAGSGGDASLRRGIYESSSSETRSWIVMAMMKLAAQGGGAVSDYVEELARKFQDSRSVGLQQRCYEFLALAKQPAVMRKVLPLDGCCEDLQVEPALPFLDGIVETAKQHGARPFDARKRQSARQMGAGGVAHVGELLPMDAYQRPKAAEAVAAMMMPRTSGADGALDFERLQATGGAGAGAGAPTLTVASSLRARHGAKRWGVKNLQTPTELAQMEVKEGPPDVPGGVHATGAGGRAPSQAFHSDPTHGAGPQPPAVPSSMPATAQTAPGHRKKEKLMKDIFGSADAANERNGQRARGIFGPVSSPSSTPAADDAKATVGPPPQTAASSVMDDLFASSPMVGPAARVTATSTTTRSGTKVWGATAPSPAAASSLPSAHESRAPPSAQTASAQTVSLVASRAAREVGRTIVTFRLSAAASAVTVSHRLQLSAPAATSLKLLRAVPASTTPAVGRPIPQDGIVFAALHGGKDASADVELLVGDAAALLSDVASGSAAIAASVTNASRNDDDDEFFRPASAALATATLPLCAADVLSPAGDDFTTSVFGQQWVKTSGETRFSLKSQSVALTDATALRAALGQVASLRVVEVIDTEWIAAATTRGPISGAPVTLLCHLAVTRSDGASVTVRCSHAGLRAAVAEALSSL